MRKKKDKVGDVGELKGMPERTELGGKAVEYLNVKDELQKDKDSLAKCAEELVKLFVAENKTIINIHGRVVRYKHVTQDQISVTETKT